MARNASELVPSFERTEPVEDRYRNAADHRPSRRAQELASLTEQNKVYKLVGPVLMKQEQSEAKHNVDKRLEWINDEM